MCSEFTRCSCAGLGKSTAFQVLPLVSDVIRQPMEGHTAIVLVIAPLSVIMEQQTAFLAKACQTVHVKPGMGGAAWDDLRNGCYSHVFVSPETIMDTHEHRVQWRDLMSAWGSRLASIVVEEAHLQLQWGATFRPSYLQLGQIRTWNLAAPVLLITATVTFDKLRQLCDSWGLNVDTIGKIYLPCCRLNTFYDSSRRHHTKRLRHQHLLEYIFRQITTLATSRYVVYCRRLEEPFMLAEQLMSKLGVLACVDRHHASPFITCPSCAVFAYNKEMDDAAKRFVERQLMTATSALRVVFATSALGCGADIKISHVIHNGPPHNMDELMQESGRAGRDGTNATSLVLWCPADLTYCDDDIRAFCEGATCKRVLISKYYGDPCSRPSERCCAVCQPGSGACVDGLLGDFAACEGFDDEEPTGPFPAHPTALLRRFDESVRVLRDLRSCLPSVTASAEVCSGLADDVISRISNAHLCGTLDSEFLRDLHVNVDCAERVLSLLADV